MTELSPAEINQLTWLTITEAADYTRQSVDVLRRAIRAQRLRHSRRGQGGKLYFKRQWLDDYMEALEATLGGDAPAVPA